MVAAGFTSSRASIPLMRPAPLAGGRPGSHGGDLGGASTALFAALIAVAQNDIKRFSPIQRSRSSAT